MKYKVGDKVRIVKEKKVPGWNDKGLMDKWLGKVMTIESIDILNYYRMQEDTEKWAWYEEMIEGEVTGMTKSDLIAGKHVVETRDEEKYLIFDSKKGKFMFGVRGGFMDLKDYDESLKLIDNYEYFDITKVYELKCPASQCSIKERCEEYLNLIWERTEPKEMTMEELEKELGYPVKIVKEK